MSVVLTAGMPGTHLGGALRLLREAKMVDLLGREAADLRRFEASGVTVAHGRLWVIFDNLPHIASVDPALRPIGEAARLVRQAGPSRGYEDIAYDQETGRWFVLVEAAKSPTGGFRPQVDTYDAAWRHMARSWVDVAVPSSNKGLEGLTCVRRGARLHLLAVSEANGNRAGRRGRRPGSGLVHVLTESDGRWVAEDRIHLPEQLPFRDYSGLSVRDDRICVVSQESSALWAGRLGVSSWSVADSGRVFPFPADPRGRTVYGTVEGVCWLDETTVATVSDRAKRDQPRRFRTKDQSVHVFAIPPG